MPWSKRASNIFAFGNKRSLLPVNYVSPRWWRSLSASLERIILTDYAAYAKSTVYKGLIAKAANNNVHVDSATGLLILNRNVLIKDL